MCPGEEEVADVYSELKIGQNLVSLVVTLTGYIRTGKVVKNLSRCEVVGVPKKQIASGHPNRQLGNNLVRG